MNPVVRHTPVGRNGYRMRSIGGTVIIDNRCVAHRPAHTSIKVRLIRKCVDTLRAGRMTLIAIGLFIGLTIIMTWPLVIHMDSAVIGWAGDNYVYIWMIGWFQKALFELNFAPLKVPILNYPQGYNLAYTD